MDVHPHFFHICLDKYVSHAKANELSQITGTMTLQCQ